MSEKVENSGYRRVTISGVLKLTSDLHLGTGEMDSYPLPAKDGQAEAFSSYNAIALDKAGKPYIPGSGLRGLLLSLTDTDNAEKWFGKVRGGSDTADHGDMGRLRVYDAQLDKDSRSETFYISRTAIDPVTGTAKQHHLSTHEVVKAGAQFRIELELDTRPVSGEKAGLIQAEEIENLLTTLQRMDGAQLGGGKSVGQGGVTWVCEPVARALSVDNFSAWLEACLGVKDIAIPETIPCLSNYFHAMQIQGNEAADRAAWVAETVYLHTQSPLLINNPHDEALDDETTGAPKLVFNKRSEIEAIIPGSTLKGWFRARCRKILLTLIQGDCEQQVDAMLGQLFGSSEQASAIRFYDACARFNTDDEHIQTFNAVDRFTGGVKEGALYTVKALYLKDDNAFKGTVSYRKDKITGWMQLLLLFAWRDAEEGDLVLGWGKAKGYGRLLMKTEGGGTEQWIKKCQSRLAQWEKDLHEELNKEVTHV